jgi:hypothetical protein
MIPGWPYSWVVALEPSRTSWTLPLDAVRLGPADDATEVTAAQVRIERTLIRLPSITCPAAATRNRYGSGLPAPAQPGAR